MDLTSNIIINIYSIVLLMVIVNNSLRHDEKESLQHKLYMDILIITAILLVVDIFGRFDGKPDTFYSFFNQTGNFLIFMLNPLLPSLWLLYVYIQVYQDEANTKKLFYPLFAVILIHTVIVIINQYSGWIYYIDSNNIYHRGSFFMLSASFSIALVLAAFALIITHRNKLGKNHYYSLLFFAVPPSICIILQIVYYGISLILNGVVISLLIVSLNIKNHSIYTDYLTGIKNRKALDMYIKERINTSTEDKTFSAIMIDFNNFKTINDTFGHHTGDRALQTTARLLESCIRANDFLARFGGDEFCIVLDISDQTELKSIVSRINTSMENYNKTSDELYKLGFSMGYAVYDYHSQMTAEEFLEHIDNLMYEEKTSTKLSLPLNAH